jgi:hypothetical protein
MVVVEPFALTRRDHRNVFDNQVFDFLEEAITYRLEQPNALALTCAACKPLAKFIKRLRGLANRLALFVFQIAQVLAAASTAEAIVVLFHDVLVFLKRINDQLTHLSIKFDRKWLIKAEVLVDQLGKSLSVCVLCFVHIEKSPFVISKTKARRQAGLRTTTTLSRQSTEY